MISFHPFEVRGALSWLYSRPGVGNPWHACQTWHADDLFLARESSIKKNIHKKNFFVKACHIVFSFSQFYMIYINHLKYRVFTALGWFFIKWYVLKKSWLARGKILCQRFGRFWHAISKRLPTPVLERLCCPHACCVLVVFLVTTNCAQKTNTCPWVGTPEGRHTHWMQT